MNTAPILFAHSGLDWITGSERCLLDLINHLDRDRFRPVVVCNQQALATAAEKLGATVYWRKWYGEDQGHFLPDRALVREGKRIVREENIRLIHANDFQPVKWLLPAARNRRIPMVLHVHIPTTRDARCYTWSHQVARVVGVSRAVLQGFLDDGLPAKRAKIIYNAVDPARLAPGDAAALRAELGLGQDIVLTAVGSLIRRKGVDVLLRALAQIRGTGAAESVARIRLLLVGDGPEFEDLQALARSAGVADMVQFLGRRNDVPTVLSASDIAVSAAREEGLPLNVLEAGFFGLPTIVSDIPPHREIVEDGRNGLIVPADDVTAFANAIVDLVSNTAKRQRLGQAMGEHVHSNFLVERYVREFTGLYDALLDRPARAYGWLGSWVWPRTYTEWLKRIGRRRLSMVVERLPAVSFR